MKLIKTLIFLLILVFPFGQLTRLPLNIPEINIYFHDIIIVFLILSWGLGKVFKKEKLGFPKLTKPILGFFITALFSLVLAVPYFKSRELIIAFLYLLRWVSYSGLYFVLTDNLKGSETKRKNILQLLLMSCTTAGFLGLLQYIFIPDIRPLTEFGWDPHYYRVVGSYLDPGYTSLIYVLGLILVIDKLFKLNKNSKKSLYLKVNFIFIYIALALTYARSGYLAYLASMLIISWWKKRPKMFCLALFFGILTIYLLPRPGGEGVKLERQSTIFSRIKNYKQALEISLDKPVFGIGFNTYRYGQRNHGFLKSDNFQKNHAGAGADSSLLFIMATTGIIGLLIYLNLIAEILKPAIKNKNLIVFVSLAAVLVHSFFNNSLFYPWTMIWLWILVGIS